MAQHLIAYLATLLVFLAIDYVWLARIARTFYSSRLGDLLLERPNYGVALAFYLVYVIGIVFFAVAPALKSGSLQTALISGALFGFFAYATYDFTNLATLKNWPVSVVIVDVAWGAVLTGISAMAGYLITKAIMGH